MSKRAMPRPQIGADPALAACVENLQVLMGQRGGRIDLLPQDASLSDVVKKINEIIERLQ